MKKYFWLTSFLFFISACIVKAQPRQFELSVYAAPGMAKVWGSGAGQLPNQKVLPVYQAGVGLQFNAPRIFSLLTGVQVERKGFACLVPGTSPRGDAVNYKYLANYNYITIPLLLRLSVGKRVQFFAEAGGYVSALFRVQVQLKQMNINDVNPGGYRYVDAGFTGGVGLKACITPRFCILFDVINSTGFLPVIKNTESKDEIKNNSTYLRLSLAYAFRPWKQIKK